MIIERWLVFKISKYIYETLWLVFKIYVENLSTKPFIKKIPRISFKIFINIYSLFKWDD